ncbi:MAG: PQQ-dependent sugar dehydrogenase [Solirubrobacteraceae bacterium]
MRRRALFAAAMSATLALAACGSGQAARPVTTAQTAAKGKSLRLLRLANFDEPTYAGGAPGDASRLYVLQRSGQVMLVLNGHKRAQPFLDITSSVYEGGGDEQGLLGIAFPADYAKTGLFYVDHTVANNDIEIVQFHRSPANANVADPASARTVLTIDHHAFTNHNGGQLAFGREGDLYIGVGDGGSEDDPNGNGQNTGTLLAKILRISPKTTGGYTIPAGNPFVGQSGRRPEIWAYGLRNPWRFSFDRTTGAMVIGDVGQDHEEELDFAAPGKGAGANYGWSIFEGNNRFHGGSAPGAIAPVLTASHSDGYCAIIGGYVVRDRSLSSLYGRYLFGDFCRPNIESVKLSAGGASGLRQTGLQVDALSSFGQDAAGHIYLVSLKGPVYRLVQR